MCGIVALYRRDGRPVLEQEILAMRELVFHRGPDGGGHRVDGSVALGHRRLSVIDLEGGYQPMSDHRGRVHLTYNGEIYNYRELRRLLESHGIPLRTHSDTETILGVYELFGDDFVEHLCGMFAFVLWDEERQRLVAVRDRLGIKPLYVCRTPTSIAFASEIKAFLPLPDWRAELDESAVAEYLGFRNLAGTATLFRGVERVAPGEMWTVGPEGESRRSYWQAPEARTEADIDTAEWTDRLDEMLTTVVVEHMVSDVPLGTFNSGGVDSSLVTAIVAQSMKEQVNSYSVAFDDPEFDESPYADIVASRFATDHRRLLVEESCYAERLESAIWHHDEPLNHPHSVHLMELSRLAKEKLTVVLTGEGSDELFAGYTRYRLLGLLDRSPFRSRPARTLLRQLAALLPARPRLRVRRVLRGDGSVDLSALAAFVSNGDVGRVLAPDVAESVRADEATAARGDCLSAVLRYDQATYLQSLLNRMDKMSMASGLEGRVPFLDHRIVELAATVPDCLKLRRFETKYLVKRVAKRYLPDSIIQRRKAGFAVPVSAWLRPGGALDPFVDQLLEPRSRRGYLDDRGVEEVVAEHRAGEADHGELLWALVNLEVWQRLLRDRSRQVESSQVSRVERSEGLTA